MTNRLAFTRLFSSLLPTQSTEQHLHIQSKRSEGVTAHSIQTLATIFLCLAVHTPIEQLIESNFRFSILATDTSTCKQTVDSRGRESYQSPNWLIADGIALIDKLIRIKVAYKIMKWDTKYTWVAVNIPGWPLQVNCYAAYCWVYIWMLQDTVQCVLCVRKILEVWGILFHTVGFFSMQTSFHPPPRVQSVAMGTQYQYLHQTGNQ